MQRNMLDSFSGSKRQRIPMITSSSSEVKELVHSNRILADAPDIICPMPAGLIAIATSNDFEAQIDIINLETGKIEQTLRNKGISDITFMFFDGQDLITSSSKGLLNRWNIKTGLTDIIHKNISTEDMPITQLIKLSNHQFICFTDFKDGGMSVAKLWDIQAKTYRLILTDFTNWAWNPISMVVVKNNFLIGLINRDKPIEKFPPTTKIYIHDITTTKGVRQFEAPAGLQFIEASDDVIAVFGRTNKKNAIFFFDYQGKQLYMKESAITDWRAEFRLCVLPTGEFYCFLRNSGESDQSSGFLINPRLKNPIIREDTINMEVLQVAYNPFSGRLLGIGKFHNDKNNVTCIVDLEYKERLSVQFKPSIFFTYESYVKMLARRNINSIIKPVFEFKKCEHNESCWEICDDFSPRYFVSRDEKDKYLAFNNKCKSAKIKKITFIGYKDNTVRINLDFKNAYYCNEFLNKLPEEIRKSEIIYFSNAFVKYEPTSQKEFELLLNLIQEYDRLDPINFKKLPELMKIIELENPSYQCAPSFEPIQYENVNCLGYALQDAVGMDKVANSFSVGQNVSVLIECLNKAYNDASFAKPAMHEPGKLPQEEKGYYQVALFNSKEQYFENYYYQHRDYHFVVQNSDGNFSHKQGGLKPVRVDSEGKAITIPEKSKFYYTLPNITLNGKSVPAYLNYAFIDYFYVKTAAERRRINLPMKSIQSLQLIELSKDKSVDLQQRYKLFHNKFTFYPPLIQFFSDAREKVDAFSDEIKLSI